MRNPFARLPKHNAARPSLRDRAAALKASASKVIRRKPVGGAPVLSAAPAVAVDPILAVLKETRRLTDARTRAAALPQPVGCIDPLPEQDAACDAFYAHVDNVLVKTVPTTPAGCVALARFTLEFLEDQGFALDEDASNEQHVRILDLIARSPMLGTLPTGRPLVPDFSGMSSNALIRTYNAFKMATDIMGLSTWAVQDETSGNRILDAEGDRLSFFQSDIADELARRGLPSDAGLASRQIDAQIDRAVTCGDYEEAARLASEADAVRL